MDIEVFCGDDGTAYMAKGHVPFDEFKASLLKEVDTDDPVMRETPEHVWMRRSYNFQERHAIVDEAKAGSRGAFKATWVQHGG